MACACNVLIVYWDQHWSAVRVAEEQSHITVWFVSIVFIYLTRCGENSAINRKQSTNDLCIQLFQGCNSTPPEVLSNGGCYSHISVRLQRVAWDAESAWFSPNMCICICMLNTEGKDYLWKCMYIFFLFSIDSRHLEQNWWNFHFCTLPYEASVWVSFLLGGKNAVSFVKTLMH